MIEHIARPEKTTRPRKCQVQLVDVFGCGRTVRSKEKMRARYTLETTYVFSATTDIPLQEKNCFKTKK